jgi:hypothetical protein
MYYSTKGGVEKRIESWKIVIPLYDNNKQSIPKTVIDDIKNTIVSNFGGLTSYEVVGYWVSGKQKSIDNNIIIIVDIPVKDHNQSSSFFLKLKEDLRRDLKQEKIYVIHEESKSELLTVNEFLKELGFEISLDQPQYLSQKNVDKLVSESDVIKKRLGYKTIKLERNSQLGTIEWEREILGIKLKSIIQDIYPKNAIILSADKLEEYFTEENFRKSLLIIGDYEYQSYILDMEKQRYVVDDPSHFERYNRGKKEPLYGLHPWHGLLKTSEFIPVFTGQVLIYYILLREYGIPRKRIHIIVGVNGAMIKGEKKLMLCPGPIPDKDVHKILLKTIREAIIKYESGTIDEIALMQTKVKNRYNEKKALIPGVDRLTKL